jgi:hypothetical protein
MPKQRLAWRVAKKFSESLTNTNTAENASSLSLRHLLSSPAQFAKLNFTTIAASLTKAFAIIVPIRNIA